MAGTGHAHLRDTDTVLTVTDLTVEFKTSGGTVKAVSGISFDVARGETLGIVGESGCGKSTTGRAIMQLPRPTDGSIVFEGNDMTAMSPGQVREARTKVQMIFQDPVSSLNPRRTVRDSVLEPLEIWKRGTKEERETLVDKILESVGIDPARAAESRPHQFSGGQCQRISVARALVLDPTLIICDEPVSALDVSVQAQVVNLLEDLQDEFELTYMFIAHDLSVVRHISDRIAVMYLGRLAELGDRDDLYDHPAHPYTHALLSAVPIADPDRERSRERIVLQGDLPSPANPPSGCRFRTRCPIAQDKCAVDEPELTEVRPGHMVACHFPLAQGESLVDVVKGRVSA